MGGLYVHSMTVLLQRELNIPLQVPEVWRRFMTTYRHCWLQFHHPPPALTFWCYGPAISTRRGLALMP